MSGPGGSERRHRAPARLGLTDDDAGPRLSALGWWDGDAPTEGADLVVWALARSPDPDLALVAVERLHEAAGEEWAAIDEALRVDQGLRGRLLAVLGGSTALGDHVVAHPDRWRMLRTVEGGGPGRVFDPDGLADLDARTATMLDAVGARPDDDVPVAHVTGHAAVELLRLAWRDDVLLLAATDLQAVSEPELPILPVDLVAAALPTSPRPACGPRSPSRTRRGGRATPTGSRRGSPSSGWASAAGTSSTTSPTST